MELGGVIDLPVFVEAGDETIGLMHHILRQFGLGTLHPCVNAATIHLVVNLSASSIEIRIGKIFVVLHATDDVEVVAKATYRHNAVVFLEIIKHPSVPACLDVEEDGIDNLHNIISSKFGQESGQLRQVHQRADRPLLRASQIHIARIILPPIAIADEQHLMTCATQGLAECMMNVAVFAEK